MHERRKRVLFGLVIENEMTVQVSEAEPEPLHREDPRTALQRYLEREGVDMVDEEIKRLLASLPKAGSQPSGL